MLPTPTTHALASASGFRQTNYCRILLGRTGFCRLDWGPSHTVRSLTCQIRALADLPLHLCRRSDAFPGGNQAATPHTRGYFCGGGAIFPL